MELKRRRKGNKKIIEAERGNRATVSLLLTVTTPSLFVSHDTAIDTLPGRHRQLNY
jgi:hypothetical protein